MHISRPLICLFFALGLGVLGCSNHHGDTDVLTYEEFKAQAYKEPGATMFIVNGDEPVENEQQLRSVYEAYLDSTVKSHNEGYSTTEQALAVNLINGLDDKWSRLDAQNLRYCISQASFGNLYSTVVNAMNNAEAAWEVAGVNFIHDPTLDGSCDQNTGGVIFDVRQVCMGAYGARAFFPSFQRADRNVLIDCSSFGNISPLTLTGILRHELGHVLGFRHEHIRMYGTTCTEDNNWRPLSVYDPYSVMHYRSPYCGSNTTGDYEMTSYDMWGAITLYSSIGFDPPVNLQKQCSADGTSVTVSWSPVAGATAYASRLNYTPNDSLSCTDGWICSALDKLGEQVSNSYTTSIVPNTPYNFWVHSIVDGNYGGASSSISFSCPQLTPPVNLQKRCSADGTSVTMSWSPVAGATAYAPRLNYTPNDSPSCTDGWICSTLDKSGEQASNSYTTSIVPNTSYNFWVHSIIDGNYGGASSSISFSCPRLTPPVNLQKQCSADGTSVTVSWSLVAGATAYAPRLDYTPNDSPSCTDGWICSALDKLGEQASNSYTTSIVPNTPYNFWVHSIVDGNYGGASSSISFSCPQLTPPVNLQKQCSADGTSVTVSWSPVAGATAYAPRLNYTPNDSPSCTDGWICSALDKLGEQVSNSYTTSIVPNTPYNFWVHSIVDGNYGGASSHILFSCP